MAVTVAQAIFGAYLLVVLLVGVVAARYTEYTPADFYLADRSVGTLILGLTFVATILSAFTVFGVGARAVATGPATFVFLSIAGVFYTLVFATVGVTLYRVGRDRDVVTPSEYVRKRYESPGLGVLYLAVSGIFMIALLAGQLVGGGVALDVLMDVPYELAIVLMAGFMLVYIHIAGYRGVVWSDTLQSIVLFGAMGGVFGYVLFGRDSGAIATEASTVTDGIFTFLGPLGVWTPVFITSFALAFVFGVPAYPHAIQRYFSANAATTVRKSGFVFAIVAIPVYFFGVALGTWSLGVIPAPADPDHVIPLMIDALLHPVVFGIVMASAVAAIMSTADSVALTMSSMVSRDVYVPYLAPDAGEKRQVRVTQLLLVVTIVVGLGLAWIRPAGIFALVAFAVVGLGTTSPPIFLGAYWTRATASGAAVSLVVGPGLLILFETGVGLPAHPFGVYHGFLSVVLGYASFVLVSLATTTPSAESIEGHSRTFLTDAD